MSRKGGGKRHISSSEDEQQTYGTQGQRGQNQPQQQQQGRQQHQQRGGQTSSHQQQQQHQQGQQQQRAQGHQRPQGQQHQRPQGQQQRPQGQPQQRPQGQPQQRPQGQPQQRPQGQGQGQQQYQQQQRPQGQAWQSPQGQAWQSPQGQPPQRGWESRQQQSQQQQQKQGSPVKTQVEGQVQKELGQGDVKEKMQASPSHQSTSSDTTEVQRVLGAIHIGTQQPVSPSKVPSSVKTQLELSIPFRKNLNAGGTVGERITVETNMFKFEFGSKFPNTAIQYDVSIDPDKPKKFMRLAFEEFRRQVCPNRYPAFDGRKIAYSANELPFGDAVDDVPVTVRTADSGSKDFKVSMKKAAIIDMAWLRNFSVNMRVTDRNIAAIQCLDIVLRYMPSVNSVPICRSIFHPPVQKRITLSGGLELWYGTFQSAVLGWKPYLNVDVSHRGFPISQTVSSLYDEICRDERNADPTNMDEKVTNKINSYLNRLKIKYELKGQPNTARTYTLMGRDILGNCPRNNRFQVDGGRSITVEEYFTRVKNYRLQYPLYPCVTIRRPDSTVISLPAELCTILPGQAKNEQKMDERQTSNMIRAAATNTTERKNKIMIAFDEMKYQRNPCMANEFNISVRREFERVPARILPTPKLKYGAGTKGPNDSKLVNVNKGVWRSDVFLTPMSLEENSWTILKLDWKVYDNDLYILKDKLQSYARNVGMSIGNPRTPFASIRLKGRVSCNEITNYCSDLKKNKVKFVIVIIPPNDAYSLIKQVSELRVGILTQCIKSQTLKKLSDATINNILLKINSKLNGINHTFAPEDRPACLRSPCIIFGADVTHPGRDSNMPSIAAVAASFESTAFKYNVDIRLQPPRMEIIQDLEDIVAQQLKKFLEQNSGRPPLRLIFYRDGVSEGQLTQVIQQEIGAINRAFKRFPNVNPKVTFLVVQKRHHIRLFPTRPQDTDDRNFNVKAGTIVDTHITHPNHIDFYLVSHASIQGTARPTKYRCIANETNADENEIEQLTYYLCHMFARCTRSVSYPAPTYYAHLAAFRARALTKDVVIDVNNLDEEQRQKLNIQSFDSPMFFV